MRDESEDKPSLEEQSEGQNSEAEEVPDADAEEAKSDEPPKNEGRTTSKSRRSPESDLRALEAVLRRTGRDLRRPIFIEGALWFGVTILAVVLSGLALAAFLPEQGYTIARWVMVGGSASATLGALITLSYFLWRRPDIEQIAARVQRHSTDFRSDLVAALEFGEAFVTDGGVALRESGFSETMARAHLARTLRRVHEESERNSLAHLVPTRDLTPPLLAFSGGVALMLIPLLLNPGWTLGVITAERAGTPVVGERVVEDTIVGSLEGVFVYPAYTGLNRQFKQLGTGYIESLEGTDVHLRATLMPGDWSSVQMVIESGEDEDPQIVEMSLENGHRASAQITVEEDGHYWFKARTTQGRPVEDHMRRRIRAVNDSAPTVRVHSHGGRVEVQPEDIIEFEFEAVDDFGIDSVRRVYHFDGSPDDVEQDRLDLPGLSNQPSSIDGISTLDLRSLNLQPKDALVVYFEARDNNTATGPGIGTSDPIVLYVESPEDKHMQNIAAQQEIMEAMLAHLADFLESPVGEREVRDDGTYRQRVQSTIEDSERLGRFHRTESLHNQRPPLIEAMDKLIEVLEDDEMMVARNLTLFKGLAEQLRSLQHNGDELFSRLESRANRRDLTVAHMQQVADYAGHTEEELERGILGLEDLLVSQKMDLVEATAEEIDNLRDRLRELLEEYRDTEDPELREAIQREIQRLRQRMAELMQRMQMQMREMPQDHINLEAMENMEMQSRADDLGDALRDIEDLIDSGDIDGALEALDQMDDALDALTNEMSDSFSDMQPQGISELDEAVAEMMDEVAQLQDIEQNIEERTQELQEELKQERQDRLDEMLEPVVDELLQEIAEQRRALDDMEERQFSEQDRAGIDRAEEAVRELQEMVEQHDMEQALDRARQASRNLRSMRNSMNLSQRYLDADSDRGRDLAESMDDTNQMIERGRQIEQTIEEFMEQAQQDLQPGEEARFDELADEQAGARERAQQLSEEIDEQSQRFPALEQELRPSMDAAQEAMGNAEEQLRERNMQPALDEERNALEHLGQLGESMQDSLEQQRQQERESGQTRDDEVDIPGEDSGEMRERLRQEMMEGMREGRIQEYESEIERYFRSLVE